MKSKKFNPKAGSELKRSLLPLAALVLLIILSAIFVPGFAKIEFKDGNLVGALVLILRRATPVILLAIGMTLVIATKGIDLSVGAVMAITGAVCALLIVKGTLPVPVIIMLGLGVSCLAGLWNGILVAYLEIQPIVATLILMVAGRGIAQLLTDGQIITFENKAFEFICNGNLFALPFPIYIAVAAAAVTMFFARKTIIGTFVEAVGGNETASTYSGINAKLVKLFVYTFSGLCAGIAGIIATSDIKAADVSHVGLYLEMDAILAVVIGGTLFTGGRFNILGSVIGAILIQTLTTSIVMRNIDVKYTLVVKAIIVILVCLMQSPAIVEKMRRKAR